MQRQTFLVIKLTDFIKEKEIKIMANYMATARTNYFRVTDETRYLELFNGLCCEDSIKDFTENRDGIIYHGFGAYSSIEYLVGDEEECKYDFDEFIKELKKILPDDEAFIYMESGYEKLRYVTGFVLVITNKETKSMSLDTWAKEQAKLLLGDDFETKTQY